MRLLPLILFSFSLAGQVNPALAGIPVSVAENAIDAVPAPAGNFIQRPDRESGNAGRSFYRWSVAAVVAVNAADAVTSWKAQEANPFVAGTGTQFGAASLAIKSGFVATSLLIQHLALRHRPDWYKRMAWMNVVTAGVLAQVARHNMSVR
jgi:hypothetical protein